MESVWNQDGFDTGLDPKICTLKALWCSKPDANRGQDFCLDSAFMTFEFLQVSWKFMDLDEP